MSKLRELFSDTLIYGISSVFARFINYLLVPLYTGIFDPEAYGVVGLVYAAIAFLNVIFTMGMESAYLRYAKDRDQASSFFKTLQLFLLGSSVLLVVTMWIIQPVVSPLLGIEQSSDIYLLMLGILLFDTLSIVPFAELRFVRKAITFASLKTGNVLINIGLNFYLILGLDYGIEAVFISNFVASIVTALVIWLITIPQFSGKWNSDHLRTALVFGLPFVPAGIGHVINEMLDRFFIKGMSPEAIETIYGAGISADYLVGIYNACYKLAVFMLLLVQMYRMAWQPFFMRQSDDADAPHLFAKAFSLFNFAAAIMVLFVALFVDHIVAIRIPFLNTTLIGEEYWIGLSIVPVLLFAYWFQGWYVNFSAGIFIKNKTKKLAQITLIGALITVIANLILIPFYGIMGSATATLLSYFVMALLIYFYANRAMEIPYKKLQAIGVLAITALAIWAKPFLVDQNFSDIAASLLLFIASVLLISVLSLRNIIGRRTQA
ncbi:MAG: polysaccharide biosynthesis C-terminal domain-containing protein [bacterium]|nr:polysaccharide biosynthesis C-terminal domain-containing protein [bacterium]